ncbi:MAG: hypothetical protein NVSMB63_13110 [Sediminibacterium sp.]
MKQLVILSAAFIAGISFANAQDKATQESREKEAAKTEIWEPVPQVITPGKTCGDAPSDAIVLYNGSEGFGQYRYETGIR